MSALRKHFGIRVRDKRRYRCETQLELSERADMSVKYLGEVERGEANATVDLAERLATALECGAAELFVQDERSLPSAARRMLLEEMRHIRDRYVALVAWAERLDGSPEAQAATEPSSVQEPGDPDMETIGVRVLKNTLSRVLKRIQGGVHLVVTDRGKPIALLCPTDDNATHGGTPSEVQP